MKLQWLVAIVILLSFATGSHAQAQLLYAGGEDIDFYCNGGGACNVSTGGSYRTGWARESYTAVGTTSDPPTNRFATPSFAANATLWIHSQFCLLPFLNGGCSVASRYMPPTLISLACAEKLAAPARSHVNVTSIGTLG